MPPHACLMFRPSALYGRPYFTDGLSRLGFEVAASPKKKPGPGDVLVLWNRRTTFEACAKAYEAAGAKVVVVENGYIGRGEGKSGRLFAMALGHHSGAGRWPACDDPDRWKRQGIELRPWRKSGDFVLVLPQRGIGERGVAMPTGWSLDVAKRLQRMTQREVRVRKHPGHIHGVGKEPYAAMAGAHACVAHGSGAAVKALAYGVPVFHTLPTWIGAEAALPLFGSDIENPKMDDAARVRMFERLAFAQWSEHEVASGEAFARVLAA